MFKRKTIPSDRPLISGVNVATINGQDIIGTSEDIQVKTDLSNYYTKEEVDSETDFLDAKIETVNGDLGAVALQSQNNENDITDIKEDITSIESDMTTLNGKVNQHSSDIDLLKENLTAVANGAQPKLVSGENIKTINNESLLGSGNIEIGSSSDIELYLHCITIRSNNFAANADYQATIYLNMFSNNSSEMSYTTIANTLNLLGLNYASGSAYIVNGQVFDSDSSYLNYTITGIYTDTNFNIIVKANYYPFENVILNKNNTTIIDNVRQII